ncbi:MAG: type III-B CRISPR module RAMP protein Cmr4 [Verrucomicrobia bacterium]|nr:type III-B CRISPR module RAMP protein Cmr4 [Verrucomicrobiota bacterium]MCH8528794.1 type III-B CRISPR module RAMP protein Cmr4 [Kiritimatiellia bacterium]
MNQHLISLFTRSPMHLGAGNSVGAIDAPIQRERHTRIPIVPGSSLKGVLADLFRDGLEGSGRDRKRVKSSDLDRLFGSDRDDDMYAGSLVVGECRVTAFPVRAAKGAFAWVTCPLSLQRLARDRGLPPLDLPELQDMMALAVKTLVHNQQMVLEEYLHEVQAEPPAGVLAMLSDLVPGDPLWGDLGKHLAIVSDEMFQYYVEHTCEVVTRVRIDDESGTVAQGALFNQEQLPSECLLTGTLGTRRAEQAEAVATLASKIKDQANLIQLGGDETIGLGQTTLHLHSVGGAA